MRYNESRTEQMIQAAMKKYAGVPKRRCWVNYTPLRGHVLAFVICAYPLTAVRTDKMHLALYYLSVLLKSGDSACVYVIRDSGAWDDLAIVRSIR